MRSLVTGGTGFIGQHLVNRLDRPVVLGRDPARIRKLLPGAEPYRWSADAPLDPGIFAGVDTVYHLAGESVFKGRWTAGKKEKILRSRIESTRHMVASFARLDRPPATFICSSGIGYYGSQGDSCLTETSPPGTDFLARVCVAWEEEAGKAEALGVRAVQIRTGVVLGKDGGALPQMLPPFRLGVGGRIGSGKQYMSWIHIDDLVGIMLYAARNNSVRGPVNGVSPAPLTNAEFTAALASALHRPAFFQVPGCVLRITLGEFAEVLLGSQRVVPETIQAAGYDFRYPDLESALADLVS